MPVPTIIRTPDVCCTPGFALCQRLAQGAAEALVHARGPAFLTQSKTLRCVYGAAQERSTMMAQIGVLIGWATKFIGRDAALQSNTPAFPRGHCWSICQSRTRIAPYSR